jgi:hypothetical protein
MNFQSEPPQQGPNPVILWGLRIVGLLAVSVISGLVWWYINKEAPASDAGPETSTTPPPGQYQFTAVEDRPRHDSSCAEHAYDDVEKFFKTTPCDQLTRAVYATSTQDGRKVYTNISIVRMRSADDAAKLRELTDKDETGNVKDLVREGIVKINGVKNLSGGGGYKAVQQDSSVIIVESDFDPADKRDKAADEKVLDSVCEDVMRLAPTIATS